MKNVLITGATGGIGLSLVDIYFNNGYFICATGPNIKKLKRLEEKYEERLISVPCDLADSSQIEKLVQECKNHQTQKKSN